MPKAQLNYEFSEQCYKMGMRCKLVVIYSPVNVVLELARHLGIFFAEDFNVARPPCEDLARILAEVLSRRGPVLVHSSGHASVSAFKGERGVATRLAEDWRVPLTNTRDSDTSIAIPTPIRLEAPHGWGSEVVFQNDPLEYRQRVDFRTKFEARELLRIFKDFSHAHVICYSYYRLHADVITLDDVERHLLDCRGGHKNYSRKVTAEVAIVHENTKLSEMREILYSGIWEDGWPPVCIGGVTIKENPEDGRKIVTDWCSYDGLVDEDLHTVLETPNGTLIYVESSGDVRCAGITNDGKHVWWFCSRTFYIVTSDGITSVYCGSHEGEGTHETVTGIDVGGDIPRALYRANDGSLWFEMDDLPYRLPYVVDKQGASKYEPYSEDIRLSIRLSDRPSEAPLIPQPLDAALSQEYHATKHRIMAQIRRGEFADGGRFLIAALREKDEELLRWLFRDIEDGSYSVDLALFDSVAFGPEYNVLKQRIRESLVSGEYYHEVVAYE